MGDHGCEYMTGGVAVIIGKTGRNFAAGMSGGEAYVLDEDGEFYVRCNKERVDLDPVEAGSEDEETLIRLINDHRNYTGSPVAENIIANWDEFRSKFVKIMPRDYKRILEERRLNEETGDRVLVPNG